MNSNKSKSLIFANIFLGSIVILFILALIYLYYKHTSLHLPLNHKLLFLSAAGLLLSIFALYLRDAWKVNVAIAVFSTLLAAYGVELVLYATYNPLFSSGDIDTRNKLEVLDDMRAEGVDAWPHVMPYLFVESDGLASGTNRIFPLGGISEKTVVYCNESGQYNIFKNDEHGFNNPKGLYRQGGAKVALLGDSYVHGACVMTGEDISSQLRNEGISALNLGNGGNGPLIELALQKEYVEPFRPEIVLWVFYEANDLFELEKERNASMLMRYFEEDYSQNLLARQDEIDAILINYVDLQWIKEINKPQVKRRIINIPLQMQTLDTKERTRKIVTLWYLRNRIGLTNTSRPEQPSRRITNYKDQLPLFFKILETAYKRTSGWGGKFYFVYLPIMERYVNDKYDGAFFDRDEILARVRTLGIPLIDFHEVLEDHPDPLSLTPFLGAHFNAAGYKLVSEVIADRLRDDTPISEE